MQINTHIQVENHRYWNNTIQMLVWLALVQRRITLLVGFKTNLSFWKEFKTTKTIIKNHYEIYKKFEAARKNPPFGVLLEFSETKTMQQESNHLDLWFRNGGWLKFSQIYE